MVIDRVKMNKSVKMDFMVLLIENMSRMAKGGPLLLL